jgi:hypothetical protein
MIGEIDDLRIGNSLRLPVVSANIEGEPTDARGVGEDEVRLSLWATTSKERAF